MSTRDRILDASADVMTRIGLARTTTKEIAREAGVSEALLYKHFTDKTQLFLAVLTERTPGQLAAVLAELPARAGHGSVRDVVEDIARAALAFYGRSFPVAASLFADTRLLAAHRDAVLARGAGPRLPGIAVAAYLAAERDLGRLRPEIDPDAAAALLLGACLQHAFLRNYDALPNDPAENRELAGALTGTLVGGVRPGAP